MFGHCYHNKTSEKKTFIDPKLYNYYEEFYSLLLLFQTVWSFFNLLLTLLHKVLYHTFKPKVLNNCFHVFHDFLISSYSLDLQIAGVAYIIMVENKNMKFVLYCFAPLLLMRETTFFLTFYVTCDGENAFWSCGVVLS